MDGQTLELLAEMICGDDQEKFPAYRSGSELTRFFQRVGFANLSHDGSTRKWWTLEALKSLSENNLKAVILRLANPKEYKADRTNTAKAIVCLNDILSLEGMKVELSGIMPQLKECKPDFFVDIPDVKNLKPLPKPDFTKLNIESNLSEVLSARWTEVEICVNNDAYLSATILMGSMLEGLFLSVLARNPKEANSAKSTPFDNKKNKVKEFAEWKLVEMIDVAHDVGWIDYDVKKYSHALRDFRNFIHPHQQMLQNCYPDKDTCNISWLVVQATVNDLIEKLK